MSLECASGIRNFTSTCTLLSFQNTTVQNFTTAIKSGVCKKNLLNVFKFCVETPLSHFYSKGHPCYQSTETFKSCLPGAYAAESQYPKACSYLSYLIFALNESSTLITSTTDKSILLLATQILRAIEVKKCAQSCEKNNYLLLGDHEITYETSRMGLSVASSLVNLGLYPFTLHPLFYIASTLNSIGTTLSQLLLALPQQQARNLDFKEGYLKCSKLKKKQLRSKPIFEINKTPLITHVPSKPTATPPTYAESASNWGSTILMNTAKVAAYTLYYLQGPICKMADFTARYLAPALETSWSVLSTNVQNAAVALPEQTKYISNVTIRNIWKLTQFIQKHIYVEPQQVQVNEKLFNTEKNSFNKKRPENKNQLKHLIWKREKEKIIKEAKQKYLETEFEGAEAAAKLVDQLFIPPQEEAYSLPLPEMGPPSS